MITFRSPDLYTVIPFGMSSPAVSTASLVCPPSGRRKQATPCAGKPSSTQVFFLARQDGRLDVWDYFYRMNEAALRELVVGNLAGLSFNTYT